MRRAYFRKIRYGFRSFSGLSSIERAAEKILQADGLYITAGAGMGVDSGLPDFRSHGGFYNHYPAYEKMGVEFTDMANPDWFDHGPTVAWGFYGHRLDLYRATTPHKGFSILLQWVKKMRLGGFVFTSNVDGHFQKAGFNEDQIAECHGSIHNIQCIQRCRYCREKFPDGIGSAEKLGPFNVDVNVMEVKKEDIPACLLGDKCPVKSIARPNILMFGDWHWESNLTNRQMDRKEKWLSQFNRGKKKLVVLEFGAGKFVPTVRYETETAARRSEGTYIRVNTRDYDVSTDYGISLPLGALEGAQKIDACLNI